MQRSCFQKLTSHLSVRTAHGHSLKRVLLYHLTINGHFRVILHDLRSADPSVITPTRFESSDSEQGEAGYINRR